MRIIVRKAPIVMIRSIVISTLLACMTLSHSVEAASVHPPRFDTRNDPDPEIRAANYRSGLITQGLVLGAWLQQSIVGRQQPVVLRLRLLNMGDQVAQVLDTTPERDFSLMVVYNTRDAGRRRIKASPAPPLFAGVERAIGPGQALEYTCRVDQMCDVSALGSYRVMASRKVTRPSGESADLVADAVYLTVSDSWEPLREAAARHRSPYAPTGAETNAAAQTESIMERRGLTVDGLRLTALSASPTVAPGQRVELTISLENHTMQVVRLSDTYPELDYSLVVLNARGDQLSPKQDGSAVASMRFRDAQPGQALAYSYDLNATYDLSEPGEYRITASRKVPPFDGEGWAEVVSNTVVLRVVEQP
jgi:hypothetical protein